MVVVADQKTPNDWSHDNVHFLPLSKQKELFDDYSDQIPLNSYTRKNLGYLYAIMNGAEWIYDTDDDNKPYSKSMGLKIKVDLPLWILDIISIRICRFFGSWRAKRGPSSNQGARCQLVQLKNEINLPL